MSPQTEFFQTQRAQLISLGYRMLGERDGAEDIVQETWLRWSEADHTKIENPRAWLRRTATNIAIDVLRSARARREHYVGPWLPEPLAPIDENLPGDAFELAQECELALLWAMENLSETERAAFILREAFDAGYEEIADILGKSQASCRQLVSRAHKRLNEQGPRFDADPAELSDLIQKFFAAIATNDRRTAMSLLSPTSVAISDGGAKARAARRPLIGPDDILTVLFAVQEKDRGAPDISVHFIDANGKPAIMRRTSGVCDTLMTLAPDASGKIAWIYVMRNPDKLVRRA
ncbi:MAG: RNA polymerase sigma factor SigJ [Pseudomonadota bacterium]